MFFLLDLITSLYRHIDDSGTADPKNLTTIRFVRSLTAGGSLFLGNWLPAFAMDTAAGGKEAGATLISVLVFGPLILGLAFPAGYFGHRIATALLDRLGMGSVRWPAIGAVIVVLGLLVGALPRGAGAWLLRPRFPPRGERLRRKLISLNGTACPSP